MITRHDTRFAQVPAWVTHRVRSGAALRVYEHLAGRYCNTDRFCFPHQTTVADDLGYTTRTVQRAIKTLRDASALIVVRSRKVDGQWGRNAYILPMRDPTNADPPSPVVDLSDLREQYVSAGGNQPTFMSSPDATFSSCREPDPLKQPHPSLQAEDQNIEHGLRPSPLRDDGKFSHANDQTPSKMDQDHDGPEDDHDTETAPVPTGVDHNRQTGLDQEGQKITPKVGPTLNEEYPYCTDWEDQRMERLMDLVGREVTYRDIGRAGEGIGELECMEEAAARDMLERGEHWKKVVATILKQFRWVDVA